jgi:MraZ protein
VAHPVLIGEYDLTIDDKNRLLIPAEIRRSIPPEYGESFYLVVGLNRMPWLYPERFYEDLANKAPTEMTPGEDRLALDHLMFAMASKLPWDKQGRVLVPEKALRRASIGKEVTLIGSRDHLELWNRADWEARHEELIKRSAEIFARARQQTL